MHSFDVEVACDVGVNAAILYSNIKFWAEKNKANDKNLKDGYYWTYNSMRAFSELFPYMGEGAIKGALKRLIEKGYIIKGEYNKSNYDRTSWYSTPLVKITDGRGEKADGVGKINRPIPDSKPDSKPYTKGGKPPALSKKLSERELAEQVDGLDMKAVDEWIDYRKKRGLAKYVSTKVFKKLAKAPIDRQQEVVDYSIENNYAGIFPERILNAKNSRANADQTGDHFTRQKRNFLNSYDPNNTF